MTAVSRYPIYSYRKLSDAALIASIVTLLITWIFVERAASMPFQQRASGMPQRSASTSLMSSPHEELFPALTCIVVDGGGNPVFEAQVRLLQVGPTSEALIEFTDRTGVAKFKRVPAGMYEVSVVYQTASVYDQIRIDGTYQQVEYRLADVLVHPSGDLTVSAAELGVPKKAKKELEKAESAYRKLEYQPAMQHVGRALDIAPRYADALALRGIIKLVTGNLDESFTDLQLAIKYDAHSPRAKIALASFYNIKGDYDSSRATSQQVLQINPRLWQAHFEMARSCLGTREYDCALREVRNAQETAPIDFEPLTIAKAQALIGLGDDVQARAVLTTFIERSPNSRSLPIAQKLLARLPQ